MKDFNWNFMLAIIAALASSMVVILGVEFVNHTVFAQPSDELLSIRAAQILFVKTSPIPALVAIPLGWILGAFAGAFVGGSICKERRRILFFIVAIFTLLAGLSQLLTVTHPWYVWVLAAFIFPGALLGSRLVKVT